MRPTVVIVDDHAGFRRSAAALLEAEGFDVVGEAADGPDAIGAVAVLRPSIVLLDIGLPVLDGLSVAEQLAAGPDPPVVVLISSRDADAYGARLDRSPARGFIRKSACRELRSGLFLSEVTVRRLGFLLGAAGIAAGLAAEWARSRWGDPAHWLPDLAVGWTFVGCGLIAAVRRTPGRSGWLLAATGFAWFIPCFSGLAPGKIGLAAASALSSCTAVLCCISCSPTPPGEPRRADPMGSRRRLRGGVPARGLEGRGGHDGARRASRRGHRAPVRRFGRLIAPRAPGRALGRSLKDSAVMAMRLAGADAPATRRGKEKQQER